MALQSRLLEGVGHRLDGPWPGGGQSKSEQLSGSHGSQLPPWFAGFDLGSGGMLAWSTTPADSFNQNSTRSCISTRALAYCGSALKSVVSPTSATTSNSDGLAAVPFPPRTLNRSLSRPSRRAVCPLCFTSCTSSCRAPLAFFEMAPQAETPSSAFPGGTAMSHAASAGSHSVGNQSVTCRRDKQPHTQITCTLLP